MASQPIDRLATPASAQLPSVIHAMHSRYEAAWDEYNRADSAKLALTGDERLRAQFQLDDGMRENATESELLRLSILHQVPTDDAELSVLAFHAWGLFDYDQNTEEDRSALGQALNSIFDYLVSEGRVDMEKMGKQFTTGVRLAHDRVRFRTGQVDEA